MRLVAQPTSANLAVVERCTALMRDWVVALLAWFCEAVDTLPPAACRSPLLREAYAASKRAVAADLRRAASHLRKLIFLRAHADWRITTGRIAPHKFARGVRPGLRAGEKRRRHAFRAFTAGVIVGMHHGSLRQRVKRLRAMLDHPAALAARVLKRLNAIWRTPHGSGVVLTASREPHASQAAPAPIAADSS